MLTCSRIVQLQTAALGKGMTFLRQSTAKGQSQKGHQSPVILTQCGLSPNDYAPNLPMELDKVLSLSLHHYFFFFVFVFLRPNLWHMEVPRLGIQSELQLLAYATATAMPDPSLVWDLHHSSWQRQILDLLSEARDRTRNLVVPSQICFHCAMIGTPSLHHFLIFFSTQYFNRY